MKQKDKKQRKKLWQDLNALMQEAEEVAKEIREGKV